MPPLVTVSDQRSLFQATERKPQLFQRPVLKLRQISNMDNIKGIMNTVRYSEDVHKLLESKTESRLAFYEKLQLSHREHLLTNKTSDRSPSPKFNDKGTAAINERTRNHLIMMSGTSVKQTAISKIGLSATLQGVPRDRDTIGKHELQRVQPVIYKHGLLIQSEELLQPLPFSQKRIDEKGQHILRKMIDERISVSPGRKEVKPSKLRRYVRNFKIIDGLRQKLEVHKGDRELQLKMCEAFVKLYLESDDVDPQNYPLMIEEVLCQGYTPDTSNDRSNTLRLSKEMLTNFDIKDLIKHLLGVYDLKQYLTPTTQNPINLETSSLRKSLPRVDQTLLYKIQQQFVDKHQGVPPQRTSLTPGYINSNMRSLSKEIERFPSLQRNIKLANEHPMNNMIYGKNIREFEKQNEDGKVIKRNRLMLEKLIIDRNGQQSHFA
ncbi:hypothetical protein FGO68_gene9695 [Halteria grandinella]|uniref:Uncharacterized protein n=1 Tax=Halteria grandinella TaxID=5974 RepID=A0A8J8NX64_HALGN|nr:hypothetical protein FGO68_gene9695 [Halteria grandinella]